MSRLIHRTFASVQTLRRLPTRSNLQALTSCSARFQSTSITDEKKTPSPQDEENLKRLALLEQALERQTSIADDDSSPAVNLKQRGVRVGRAKKPISPHELTQLEAMREIKKEKRRLEVSDILSVIDEEGGLDVKVLDVSKLCDFAEHFIVVSGGTIRHIAAIADRIVDDLRAADVRIEGRLPKIEGSTFSDDWLIVDGGNIVLHCFTQEGRTRYKIEEIWSPNKIPASSSQNAPTTTFSSETLQSASYRRENVA
eukprot:TRINITY_DN16133_c0_g1::TRINITY_DN16133_c0_g1_i1::g.6360::m.6360 TRINITY_DN16133_c0_g1::TRINITY_DN16133_c0_g1_i1::g.6360  ORF type:complete len:268 (-),score=9.38,sp/P0AAT8/IOJAP_SHIFL/35.29/4e-12,Oligomerisation/PF02410.10/9.9e-21 TRINITY_DN16133_c0_g1_i1:215-979(-)